VLNTIVAEQLRQFKISVDALIKKGTKKDEAIFQVLRSYIVESKDIRFEGNGYGQEWADEAKKRGLNNIKNTPEALSAVISESTIDLMKRHDVLTKRELEARYEIDLESYTKKIQIESRVMGDLAINHIIPTAIQYQSMLVNNVRGLKDILEGKDYKNASAQQIDRIIEISDRIRAIRENADAMVEARRKANALGSEKAKALAYNKKVLPFFEPIRYEVDKLELMVSDDLWPLPKYREMLFGH
jgi:glutamine synthetase